MAASYERFHWDLGNCISYGPDFAENLKDRHSRAVREISSYWKEPEGVFLGLKLDSQHGGRFFTEVITPGAHKPSYSRKHREARIWIGIPLEMVRLNDEQFRALYSDYLLDGTEMLLKYLHKQSVQVDYASVLLRIEEIISRYKQLTFPLPPSSSEDNIAMWYEARRLHEEGGRT